MPPEACEAHHTTRGIPLATLQAGFALVKCPAPRQEEDHQAFQSLEPRLPHQKHSLNCSLTMCRHHNSHWVTRPLPNEPLLQATQLQKSSVTVNVPNGEQQAAQALATKESLEASASIWAI